MARGEYVRTPEIREKNRIGRLNKKMSADAKNRISIANSGKPRNTKFSSYYPEWERLYAEGAECHEIALKYGCSTANVFRVMKKLRVARHKRPANSLYSTWEELYNSGSSASDIAKLFGCSDTAIYYGLKKQGAAIRDNSRAHRIYSLDEEFFDTIDDEFKAYWLGFISADGCISSNSNRLIIGLSARDSDRLYEFLRDVKSNAEPTFYKGGYNKTCEMVRIDVNNKHLIEGLKKCALTPAKSLTMRFCDEVPPHLWSCYILGYFDGDGSIYFDKSGKPSFALVGTFSFLEKVQEILISVLGLNKTKIRSKGKISELRYGGRNNVIQIRNWLYDNTGPRMQRKKDRFDSVG